MTQFQCALYRASSSNAFAVFLSQKFNEKKEKSAYLKCKHSFGYWEKTKKNKKLNISKQFKSIQVILLNKFYRSVILSVPAQNMSSPRLDQNLI